MSIKELSGFAFTIEVVKQSDVFCKDFFVPPWVFALKIITEEWWVNDGCTAGSASYIAIYISVVRQHHHGRETSG